MAALLACNHCAQAVDGLAFVTCCNHLLCPTCANRFFAADNACPAPACLRRLQPGDVMEVAVGISSGPTLETLFQTALQSPDINGAAARLQEMVVGIGSVASFLLKQQALGAAQQEQFHKQSAAQQEQFNVEMQISVGALRDQLQAAELRAGQAETMLAKRGHELDQLGEALKDKVRKCAAWEKAYSTVRDQLASRAAPTSTDDTSLGGGHVGGQRPNDHRMQHEQPQPQPQQQRPLFNQNQNLPSQPAVPVPKPKQSHQQQQYFLQHQQQQQQQQQQQPPTPLPPTSYQTLLSQNNLVLPRPQPHPQQHTLPPQQQAHHRPGGPLPRTFFD